MKKEEQKKAISRRDFLKGTATGAASIAAATMLGGCAKKEVPVPTAVQPGTTTNTSSSAGIKTTPQYEVINTDILIIGAGLAATAAAMEALTKGQRVMLVDKGPFRHGGGAGYNWDLINEWMPDKTLYANDILWNTRTNQELLYKVTQSDTMDGIVSILNRDQCIPDRAADGSPNWYVDFPMFKGVQSYFPRFALDALAKSPLVSVIDQTMITDLLINDDRCLGAMGIYLPTGDFRVFRAEATILATGATTWFYGWNTVQANSINTPDNTGDVDMAAFRHGAGIGDSEYAAYDFATTYPIGLGYGWNTMLNPDPNEWESFADKNGNLLFTEETAKKYGYDLTRFEYDRPYFCTELAKAMARGAMDENGGLKANLKDVPLRPIMVQNLPVFEKFGVEPFAEMLPIHDEMYEHVSGPVVADTTMSEDFKGLFCIRGAGANGGSSGGMGIYNLQRNGPYALRCALEYIKTAPALKEIDWSVVETEYNRLHEIRTRQVKSGLRPHVVRHAIQKTCGTCMGILRDGDKLKATAKELARIRAEDIPNMVVPISSQTFNTEWKEAIENYNLLDAAELAVNATLVREESPGGYLRTDFPEMDDANWKVMLVGKQENDKLVFTKKPLTVHAT